MVSTSFTLRKTSSGYGSYTRKDATDTALKADGYVSTTNALVATSTFSANVITTDEVLLSWALSFSLVETGIEPAPISISIVASATGEPQTIQDGSLVYTTSSNSASSHADGVRVEKGRWVYYSLFAKYSDFAEPATTWYERLASLYIQIPKDYLSVNNLWARIPEYYRMMDAEQPDEPLYNFLELFGWEIDRLRTLIDSVALSNDPELAVTPALAELAYQMGLETTIEAVGTTKVRKLLNRIGEVRRHKGTQQSIIYYLNALTGCTTTYLLDSGQHIFNVHSQRINFAADPTFNQASTSSATGTGSGRRTSKTVSSTWGVYSYGASSTTGASVTTTGSELTVSNVGTGTITALVYQKTPFPYYPAADLYTNFTPNYTSGASFTNFHLAEPSVVTAWEGGVSGGSMPAALYYDTWNTTLHALPDDSQHYGEKQYELVSNSTSQTTVSVVPVLTFELPAGSSVKIKNWLVEPYTIAEYFDGNTREGGLLPSLTGEGTGVSDYRWAGTANASFSYYTLDYKRMTHVTEDIIKNYIAPVTVKDDTQIIWNYYYGK